jgi:vesicular inhibitory amino acid transporter
LTIAAAPNLGSIFKAPSVIYSSFLNLGSRSNLDLHDGKTPFLSGAQISEGVPRQSTWWEKASIQMHFPEELPIGYGCTFTQTIFNGMYYVLSFCMLTYQRPLMPMKHRHQH